MGCLQVMLITDGKTLDTWDPSVLGGGLSDYA